MTPQLNPQKHLQWFKHKISKIDQVVLFLILMLCTILYSSIHLSASTHEIKVNYIDQDLPLADTASVCDTDLDHSVVTCTLRAAIQFANANPNNGTVDEIVFSELTGDDIVINIGSDLPQIIEQVYIDGTDLDGDVRDITIDGQNNSITGFLFDGDDSHGSKLENLVVRGFKTFNLKINDSDRTDGSSTYLIQNNYFGVDQDGSSVYTGASNYNVFFYDSDHINFNSNTAAGEGSYHLYASYSDNINIQNSNLGTSSTGEKIVDNSGNMVVSGWGVLAANSDNVTIHNNIVGGIEGLYAIEVQTGDNFTITDNRVCISPTNVNLCKDGYGIQIDGVHNNYSTGGTITGNTVDGKDATNGNSISGISYGVGLVYVDNLTFSNNILGMTNGFYGGASALIKMKDVHSSTFSKGANGAFGTSYYGIYFSSGNIYNNTFEDFEITWVSGTPSGQTSGAGGFSWSASRTYKNTFSNIKISGANNGMYNLDSAFEEFNYFDGVSVFDVTNSSFSNVNPLVHAQNGLQSGTPTVNSTSYSNGNLIVNLSVSATVTGESCSFIAYISDVDGEADTYLVLDSENTRQIAGTLESGTCTLSNQDFIVPDTYTIQNSNDYYIVTAVTDIISSDTLASSSTQVSDIKETSAYSASDEAEFDFPVSASISLDDGDGYSQVDTTGNGVLDTDDVMFPYTTTITLDASGSTYAASYAWDVDTDVDSDNDGATDNDVDATGSSVTVNYGTSKINGTDAPKTLTSSGLVNVKVVATGILGDTNSTTLTIKPMNPELTGGIGSCEETQAINNEYEAMLMDMSAVQPVSLYWDFDTLTDAGDDGNPATNWDGDGDPDNDIQATSDFPIDRPSYPPGNYRIGLFHFDKLNQEGQSIALLHDLEVVEQIVTPTPTFGYSKNLLEVSFTDTSTGGCMTNWAWDFDNDGVTDSTLQNPTHTFPSSGTYTVKLTATNSVGTAQSAGTSISVNNNPPTADFNTSGNNILVGDTVSFSDTSTGTDISGYSWDFNDDGVEDSTDQNPSHTFSNTAGVIPVSLTVTNPAGSDTHTVNINVTPKAEFTLDDGSGNAALEFDGTEDPTLPNQGLIVPQSQVVTLNVTNPIGGVNYTWDLNTAIHSDGDSNPANDVDATGQAVTVNYETGAVNGAVNNNLLGNSGDISIKLTASSGGLESTQDATIRVFSATGGVSANCLAKNTQLTFTNSSTGFESSSYNFGDGTVVNHLENTTTSQTHTYNTAGEYTAVLSVFDNATVDGQSDTNSHTIVVEESIDSPSASATYTKFVPDPADDFHAQFTNTSTGGCLSYEWDFDEDGATDSTDKNPTHDFGALGTYPVTLTVLNNQGTDTVTFDVVITDAGPTAGFTPSVTSGQAPLTVDFTNTTTGTGFTSQWDFETDGNTDSILNNTQKEFTTPGVYRVTLSVTNYEGNSTTFQDITVHPKSTFTFSPNSGNTNTEFTFTADFQDEANYDYAWDIDSDGSNDGVVPVFTDASYSSAGSKTAKLTVTSKANPALTSFTTSSVIEVAQVSSGSSSSTSSYSAPVKSSSNDQSSDSSQSESDSSQSVSDSESSDQDSSQDQSESDNEPASEPVAASDDAPASEPEAASDDTPVFESEVIAPVVIPVTEPSFEAPAEEAPAEETATEEAPAEESDESETPADESDETDEPEAPAEETDESEASAEEPEGFLDNLAGLLTGALIAEQPLEQTLAEDQPELPAIEVQTEVVKVEDEQVEQELTEVFATKSEEVLTNQEKQTQVLAKADVSEKKKTIASKVVVDTEKQKEIVTKVIEKVKRKQEQQQAQQQEVVKTIQAQDEDNNGVSDAIQELIGLSNEEIEVQQQEDPNLLAPRAIFLNPNNATADIMLEMRESETYPDDKFIANGIVDAPQAQAGDIVEFYAQKDGEKLLIGASRLDENKNFSYVNRSELEPGQYDIVAKLESDGAAATEFSVPVEVTIDPQAEQIPVTLDGFSGQTSDTLQARTNTAFANTHDVISGVVLQPNEPVSLALNVDSELARVVVNFNSVLYSATAITSSTNSQIEVDAPLELSFQPGTSHTATAFAESIEDPNIKSKPIIIEFSIANQTPWYLSFYALILYGVLLVGISGAVYHSRGLSA